MSDRKTLTLRPVPYVDAAKVRKTEELGFRFVDRRGRYILQAHTVFYREVKLGEASGSSVTVPEHTWVDIPLVPEVYA